MRRKIEASHRRLSVNQIEFRSIDSNSNSNSNTNRFKHGLIQTRTETRIPLTASITSRGISDIVEISEVISPLRSEISTTSQISTIPNSSTYHPCIEEQIWFASKKKKNPDILTYNEAMNDTENLPAWLAAALKEIIQLQAKYCWEDSTKSEAIAANEKVIPCTWVFRFKRNPAGDIIKCKARICLRGDLMDDDQESFAPVCAWSSV